MIAVDQTSRRWKARHSGWKHHHMRCVLLSWSAASRQHRWQTARSKSFHVRRLFRTWHRHCVCQNSTRLRHQRALRSRRRRMCGPPIFGATSVVSAVHNVDLVLGSELFFRISGLSLWCYDLLVRIVHYRAPGLHVACATPVPCFQHQQAWT